MLSQFIFTSILLASLICWLRFAQRWMRNKSPLLAPRMRIQSPIGLTDVGILFLGWITSQFVAVLFSLLLFRINPAELASMGHANQLRLMGMMSLSQLVFTFLSLGFVATRYGYAPRIFGWQPENFLSDLKIGVVGFVMIAPIIMTVQSVLTRFVEYDHESLSILSENPNLLTMVLTWFSAAIVAPITEEIFFRGTFQAWLQRQDKGFLDFGKEPIVGGWKKYTAGGESDAAMLADDSDQTRVYTPVKVISDHPYRSTLMWSPIFISAFIFGGVHFGQGLAPIPLFLFGIALGYAYRQTGSIVPCVVMHFLLNAVSLLVFTYAMLTESGVPQ